MTTAHQALEDNNAPPTRRWMSVKEAAREYPFSEAALRALFQRSRPHYDSKSQLVDGNGLASAFCQPGGRNGRVVIDTFALDRWLEQSAGQSSRAAA